MARQLPRTVHEVNFVECRLDWNGTLELVGKGRGREYVLRVPLLSAYSLFKTIKEVLKQGYRQLDTLHIIVDRPIRRNPDGSVLD